MNFTLLLSKFDPFLQNEPYQLVAGSVPEVVGRFAGLQVAFHFEKKICEGEFYPIVLGIRGRAVGPFFREFAAMAFGQCSQDRFRVNHSGKVKKGRLKTSGLLVGLGDKGIVAGFRGISIAEPSTGVIKSFDFESAS